MYYVCVTNKLLLQASQVGTAFYYLYWYKVFVECGHKHNNHIGSVFTKGGSNFVFVAAMAMLRENHATVCVDSTLYVTSEAGVL